MLNLKTLLRVGTKPQKESKCTEIIHLMCREVSLKKKERFELKGTFAE